jgi:hypothetical protein
VSEEVQSARIDPEAGLRSAIATAGEHWATDPALFRRLPPAPVTDTSHRLAAALAAADQLRPGCSLREADDVIAIVLSFSAFDGLHHDGRRSPAAVADILFRMASAILAVRPA